MLVASKTKQSKSKGITAKTVEGALSEAKKAGTDAAAALNTYKTDNDKALAAVKKTADDNKAAIAQINTDLGGLTGAMHFVGTSNNGSCWRNWCNGRRTHNI
mgnify:CR=1 FL=1